MNFCVIVPVYNSPYIRDIVVDILDLGYKLIVVDDGSDEIIHLQEFDVELIRHKTNKGKGKAILSGALKARELGYDYFLTMDGDKQHLSSQIAKMRDAYIPDSIIIGNRNFLSSNIPKSSRFGRKFSNFWVMLEIFKSLGDTQSGFRIYPISILDLKLKHTKFDFEIEVLALHAYRGGKIIDVDVECYYPPSDLRISHFDKFEDNARITLLHIKLLIQRYLFFRGWLWR